MQFETDALDALTWLQVWYASQCDGDWEHQAGIDIQSLDNPGWRLRIDLTGTALRRRSLDREVVERSEDDWFHVWADGDSFHGAGGPTNLGELVHRFRTWAESHEGNV